MTSEAMPKYEPQPPEPEETDEEILARLYARAGVDYSTVTTRARTMSDEESLAVLALVRQRRREAGIDLP